MEKDKNKSLLHNFNEKSSSSFFSGQLMIIFLIVILFGIGSGYLLSQKSGNSSKSGNVTNTSSSSSISTGVVVGSDDLSTFKDPAEGILKEGGIEGEGQYHLVRPGGESQNVYLTSSIVDLSKFIDKKIKIWGQTQKAMKAGWLMDVGRVEVL